LELDELSRLVIGLAEKSHAEKIKIFGWYLHTHKALAHFQVADIRKCYETLNFVCPLSFSGYFNNLLVAKEVLKNRSDYRLENRVREALDAHYGSRAITVQVTDLLLSLPDKVPDLAERTYLDEALVCFKLGLFEQPS
jgi:hypothetical protein